MSVLSVAGQPRRSRLLVRLGLLAGLACLGTVQAQVATERSAAEPSIPPGLRSWEWRQAGIVLQLVQRLPDQTRAFFQARGFSSDDSERIATACVFQTIFRNDGKYPLAYDLADWRVTYRGESRPLLTREAWDTAWDGTRTGAAARIALRWALLPTRQSFQPGDYNWGMTSFGLPPGARFDLGLVVAIDGQPVTRTLTGLVCAAESTAESS